MGGHWRCFYTDACMAPTCYTQEWNLDGATCEKAKETISTVYPGMTTICLKESDPMPTEDDLDRYIVVTNNDITGLVTDVVFNRNAQCPTAEIFKENKSCSVFGQKCDIVLGTSTRADGSICTQSTRCTCEFGTFFCGPTTESDCAKADPIATTPPQVIVDNLPFDEGGCPLEGFGFEIFNEEVCPPTSPLDSLDSSCTAEGVTCHYGKEAWYVVLAVWTDEFVLLMLHVSITKFMIWLTNFAFLPIAAGIAMHPKLLHAQREIGAARKIATV